MRVEQGVSVQEGPRTRRHVFSTLVRGSGASFWVSTIISPETRGKFETRVFPVPPGVDTTRTSEGDIEFTQPISLPDVTGELGQFNLNNIPLERAKMNHQEAIQHLSKLAEKV